ILKNNVTAPFDQGAVITVTHPGGKVLLDGIIVKAIDEAFLPLPVNQDVVLFLKFIPETRAYELTNDTGSFELDGSTLQPLTKDHFPPGVLQNGIRFLQTVRSISAQ